MGCRPQTALVTGRPVVASPKTYTTLLTTALAPSSVVTGIAAPVLQVFATGF
jgi:hypothetical protein